MAEPIITAKGSATTRSNAQALAIDNTKAEAAKMCEVSKRDIGTSSFSDQNNMKCEQGEILATWTCNVKLFAKDAKELCAKIVVPNVLITIDSRTQSFIEGKGWKLDDGTVYQANKKLCEGNDCEVDFRGGPDTGGYNKSVVIERLLKEDPAYANSALITVVEQDDSKHIYILDLDSAKIVEK